MIPVPIPSILDANRVPRDESKETERVASFQRILKTAGSSKARQNSSLHDQTSNNPRINGIGTIIRNPELSLLFKEFLQNTHCWENFAFYLEVTNIIAYCDQIRHTSPRLNTSQDTQAALHRLYHDFLARNSPWEVNIDQSLRAPLVALVTNIVEGRSGMIESLENGVGLLRQAHNAIFELLASDSLPKFLSRPEYAVIFQEYSSHPTSG